jgi:hypothetical protein
MGPQFGGCRRNLWKCHTVKGKVMNTNSIRMLPNATPLGVSVRAQRIIRQDPLDEFARSLGCRLDDLLQPGESSRQHLLALEFDLEEVTKVIAARRPPLEESILWAQRLRYCRFLFWGRRGSLSAK